MAAYAGAAGYVVQVDCLSCCANGQWCSDLDRYYRGEAAVADTAYTFEHAASNPGRWRVWALDENGRPGAKSEWREFSYTV